MSKGFKFELNRGGVRELLKSSEISGACEEVAAAAYAQLGDGYVMEPRNYPERSGYAIYPKTREAERDNRKNNSLLKAVGGG